LKCASWIGAPVGSIVRDQKYPQMWRVVRLMDGFSGTWSTSRAKDVAWGIAESRIFVARTADAAESQKPILRALF